jgi:hypothetical protein
MNEIHFKHTNPLDFSFRNLDKTQVTIYVPKGLVKAYQEKIGWSYKIEEEKEEE